MGKNIGEEFNSSYIEATLETFKRQRELELSHLGFIKKFNDINDRYNNANNNDEKDTSIIIAKNLIEIKYLLKEMFLIIRKG